MRPVIEKAPTSKPSGTRQKRELEWGAFSNTAADRAGHSRKPAPIVLSRLEWGLKRSFSGERNQIIK